MNPHLDERVIPVAVSVIFREDTESFLVFSLSDEESRAFGDEPQEEQLEDGWGGLKNGGNSP